MLDAAREERRRRSGGREGGDGHMYPPLLSCCGRDEGTSGSPAGRRTRVGGWGLSAVACRKNRVCPQSVTPFAIGVQIAPGSKGALAELAMRPLWR